MAFINKTTICKQILDSDGTISNVGSWVVGHEELEDRKRIIIFQFSVESRCAGITINLECQKYYNYQLNEKPTGNDLKIYGKLFELNNNNEDDNEEINECIKALNSLNNKNLILTVPGEAKIFDPIIQSKNILENFILKPEKKYILILFSDLSTGFDVIEVFQSTSLEEYNNNRIVNIYSTTTTNNTPQWLNAIPYICVSKVNEQAQWAQALPYICTNISTTGPTWKSTF